MSGVVFLAGPLEGLDDRTIQELGRIEKGLQKFRSQGYGICESCGRKISQERLCRIEGINHRSMEAGQEVKGLKGKDGKGGNHENHQSRIQP